MKIRLHSHANKSHFHKKKASQVGVFGTLVEICDSRKFPGCEFELRIQVHKGKGISANVVMQIAGHKCKNQHKAMH